MYSDVLTSRSDFFKAARKPEWLADPAKPTELPDEQPEVFARYLNCVYFGIQALQIDADAPEDNRHGEESEEEPTPDAFLCSEAEYDLEEPLHKYVQHFNRYSLILADLYLLADRLQDLETANLVMDEFIGFSDEGGTIQSGEVIRRVYESTAHGNPLRKLMRDTCVYDSTSSTYMEYHLGYGHPEFARDVMVELLKLRDSNSTKKVEDVYDKDLSVNKCHYHQHDKSHPRCALEPGDELEPSTIEEQGRSSAEREV